MDSAINYFSEYGNRSINGNLLSVQPDMSISDYESEETYFSKLNSYLKVAKDKNWLSDRTIAVFPEYIGTWLIYANDLEVLLGSNTSVEAMLSLAKAKWASVIKYSAIEIETIFEAIGRINEMHEKELLKLLQVIAIPLFHSKAKEMAEIYHKTFRQLSKKYGITIVAGSIVLPNPNIIDGDLVINPGDLFNISVVYKPDGSPHEHIVHKAHPTDEELTFTTKASSSDLPTFHTPAGKLGVLICADAWHSDSYTNFITEGVELIAAPSYVTPAGNWDEIWQGYSPPIEEDQPDIGLITEKAATLKYATGKILQCGVKCGIQTYMRGTIWDLDTDGCTLIVHDQAISEASDVNGAALVNLWI